MTTNNPFTRNEVTFMGRMGKDPEMSFTTKGTAVTKLSLAVWQGQNKDAMWLNIVCWKKLAEQVNERAQKGDLVEVRGRLTQRKWEGKYYHDVVADSVEVVGRKEAGANTSKYHSTDDLGELDEHPF